MYKKLSVMNQRKEKKRKEKNSKFLQQMKAKKQMGRD